MERGAISHRKRRPSVVTGRLTRVRTAEAHSLDGVQGGPYAGHVGGGVQGHQLGLVEMGAGGHEAPRTAVDDDARVEELAALHPWHHAQQRVLEDIALAHRWPSLSFFLVGCGQGVRCSVSQPGAWDGLGSVGPSIVIRSWMVAARGSSAST